MFFLFVITRFYSKLVQKCWLFFSYRSRDLFNIDKFLVYPPNIKSYEEAYHKISKFHLNSSIRDLKKYSKSIAYAELISLHKYYNSVLNTQASLLIYHEILRRNSKASSLLRPFGVRRFLASQIMLGGIGIPTRINQNYPKKLIAFLCLLTNFDSNRKYSSYLRDKSISLCGGAPSPRENLEDISSNDVVVRLNRDEVSGESVDIVYFRSEKLNTLATTGALANFSKVKYWLSIKTFRHYLKLRYIDKLKKIAPTVSLDTAFDSGKLNAIPTVALDLISRSCGTIHIFDTDLNLSKRHKEGYRGADQPDVRFDLIFGEHPSYIQFTVLRYLYLAGFLKFEKNPNFDIGWKYTKFNSVFSRVYG